MLRHLKSWIALLSVMASVQQGHAWTGWNPLLTWQTANFCYGVRYWYNQTSVSITNNQPPTLPGNVGYTEPGGPATSPAQSGRMNVAWTSYAYDPTFVTYFGVEGMKAVDGAFAILNNLPTASSANLSQFLTQGNQQVNYTARALSMLDLKSTVLQLMIEHLGLLGETHVFDLRAEQAITGVTCGYAYFVIVDNFDPGTFNPSTYVNGTCYDYYIQDGCSAGIDFADAMEEVYDEPGICLSSSAVATQEALQIGGYYLGITRDDMGGLSCLYSSNNFRYETMFTDVYLSPTEGVLNSPFNPIGTTNTNSVATNTNTMPTFVGGVEKVNFYKVSYNPAATTPTTNVFVYTIPGVNTNNRVQTYTLYRTNTTPDIIISAADLLTTGTALADTPFTRTYAWIASPETTYPSVMSPTMTLVINNVGPLSVNESPGFLQGSALFIKPFFQFGSFDGSTNPPVTYPQNTSLSTLLNNLFPPVPGNESIINSPFNVLVTTNTVTATGTTSGTVIGTAGTPATFTPAAQPAGGKSN
jgi:hypothetical protein